MSTTLTGDATASDLYLSRTVTGATNASPIVITTSASHLFATGDRVVVASVGGNTAANGEFYITKVSATTFSLDGSTGNGAYTSGGTAACITMTPQFTIPADGDNLDAASVNAALEALADRTQLLAIAVRNRVDEFTANGTWTCPDNVFAVELEGCGGGGGGGTGGDGAASTDRWPPGGAGGGGAPLVRRGVAVTPGTTYTVTIGGGGATDTDGTDTTFDALATFPGGGKGRKALGVQSVSATTPMVIAPGTIAGATHPSDNAATASYWTASAVRESYLFGYSGQPGEGGAGLSSNSSANAPSRPGVPSVTDYAGGAAGAHGSDSGSYRGGGGGGGGGGGPYGVGGAGGAGPNGNGVGAGSAGVAGSAAAANTGAGGGGGSSGSCGTSTTPAGGAGGAGGSGRLKVFYVGPKATVT